MMEPFKVIGISKVKEILNLERNMILVLVSELKITKYDRDEYDLDSVLEYKKERDLIRLDCYTTKETKQITGWSAFKLSKLKQKGILENPYFGYWTRKSVDEYTKDRNTRKNLIKVDRN